MASQMAEMEPRRVPRRVQITIWKAKNHVPKTDLFDISGFRKENGSSNGPDNATTGDQKDTQRQGREKPPAAGDRQQRKGGGKPQAKFPRTSGAKEAIENIK